MGNSLGNYFSQTHQESLSAEEHYLPSPDKVLFPQLDRWSLIKSELEKLLPTDSRQGTPVDTLLAVIHAVSGEPLELKNLEMVLRSEEFNTLFPDFFTKTLKGMAQLALSKEEMDSLQDDPIPILKCKTVGRVTLSRRTVAFLLCHAFFCTFDKRKEHTRLPIFNFTIFYIYLREEYERAKFYAIINYFTHIVHNDSPHGNLSVFRQRVDPNDRLFPDFKSSTKEISDVEAIVQGAIENAEDTLQVDFANSYIGGGVLCGGCVQEEIRFAFCPELIAACLFCDKMDDNEAIIMVGCQQFSEYSGYGKNLKYKGNYLDPTPFRDYFYQSTNLGPHINTEITAIDAIDFRSCGLESQFSQTKLLRELIKSYVGFLDLSKLPPNSPPYTQPHDPSSLKPIATGHWGCGVFGGNKAFKSIIQILAASEAGRNVKFYSFGDKNFVERFNSTYKLIKEKKKTVGDLYNLLLRYESWKRVHPGSDFFDLLKEALER